MDTPTRMYEPPATTLGIAMEPATLFATLTSAYPAADRKAANATALLAKASSAKSLPKMDIFAVLDAATAAMPTLEAASNANAALEATTAFIATLDPTNAERAVGVAITALIFAADASNKATAAPDCMTSAIAGADASNADRFEKLRQLKLVPYSSH